MHVRRWASLFSSLTCSHVSGISPEPFGKVDWQAYERGLLGLYPQVNFRTIDISAPLVHVRKWDSRCDNTSLTFLTPRGSEIPRNRAFILDHAGTLVMALQEQGAISNMRVQMYRGDPYLTYWVGDDRYENHGLGFYKMLDQTYTLSHTISALGGLDGDYHEFSITRDNTALLTAYIKTPWDLSNLGGRQDGYIWDCAFQEVDIDRNEILFEWRASKHFQIEDSGKPLEHEGFEENPWDWFHLNSVDKSSAGNYLISSRFRNSVASVDRNNGKLLWQLGGTQNSLIDLSQGQAKKLWNPRMAQWRESESAIILFHNSEPSNATSGAESCGLKIRVNAKGGSAKLLDQFKHPDQLFTDVDGSIETLPNGNLFVGYGSVSAYSEFLPNGNLICDTWYSPSNATGSLDSTGSVAQSYRIHKNKWHGLPKERPSVKLDSSSISVSWNGATEVRAWHLAGRDSTTTNSQESWNSMGKYAKNGFETKIILADDRYSSYRLTALASDGNRIRSWDIHPEGDVWEIYYQTPYKFAGLRPKANFSKSTYSITIALCCALLTILNRRPLLFLLRFSKMTSRNTQTQRKTYTPMAGTRHQLSPLPKSNNPFEVI